MYAEVKDSLAQIVYEYHDFNLKEFMRKVSLPSQPLAPFSKSKSERPILSMPLDTIKTTLY